MTLTTDRKPEVQKQLDAAKERLTNATNAAIAYYEAELKARQAHYQHLQTEVHMASDEVLILQKRLDRINFLKRKRSLVGSDTLLGLIVRGEGCMEDYDYYSHKGAPIALSACAFIDITGCGNATRSFALLKEHYDAGKEIGHPCEGGDFSVVVYYQSGGKKSVSRPLKASQIMAMKKGENINMSEIDTGNDRK